MEPSWKAPGMEAALNDILGCNRRETIEANRCTCCKGDASEFRNEISRKEYSISGLCQKCQDEVFGED